MRLHTSGDIKAALRLAKTFLWRVHNLDILSHDEANDVLFPPLQSDAWEKYIVTYNQELKLIEIK